MGTSPVVRLTANEYLALDRESELKSEFHDGILYPIVAVSLEHSRIAARLAWRLGERLQNSTCQTCVSPLRVRVSSSKYVYPDLLVVCGAPAFADGHNDTITNPRLIVEILSPSTADYDYGAKFALYRRLQSLEEYVLVSQDPPEIDVYRRSTGGQWVLTPYEGLAAVARFESLNIEIPLAEIYPTA